MIAHSHEVSNITFEELKWIEFGAAVRGVMLEIKHAEDSVRLQVGQI